MAYCDNTIAKKMVKMGYVSRAKGGGQRAESETFNPKL